MWKRWNGKKALSAAQKASFQALDETMKAVGELSDSQVPLDEGTLRRSRHQETRMQGDAIVSKLGYGGGGESGKPVVPYALRWHEEPARFQRGRKHNYLRDPFNQSNTIFPEHTKKSFRRQGF